MSFRLTPQLFAARATTDARAVIKRLLSKDDRLLDDIGYTRPALEWALRARDPETALAQARRLSKPSLRTAAPRRGRS